MCINDCGSGALGYLRTMNFKMVSSEDFAGRCACPAHTPAVAIRP